MFSLGDFVLVLLTSAYLLLELSFNARLLDVAGGAPNAADLEGVEFFGRILSGIGAALLIWKLAHKHVRRDNYGLLMLCCLMVVPLVFVGQRLLIDYLVDRSDGEQRQRAVLVATLRVAAQQNVVQFRGLDMDDETKASPAGKTLLTVFPALFYGADKVHESVEKHLTDVVAGAAHAQIGGPQKAYNDFYLPVANEIRRMYNDQYVPASNKFSAAEAGAKSPDQAWHEYMSELENRRIDPYGANEMQRRVVIKRLRKSGVHVHDDFQLGDEEAFRAAFPSTRRSFSDRVSQALGFKSNLPPGLSFAQFASHKDIRSVALSRIKQRRPDLAIQAAPDLNASEDDFNRRVYDPMVKDFVQQRVRALTGQAEMYVKDKAFAEQGREAVRAMLVPPLALGLSLFFGLLNLVGLLASLVPTAIAQIAVRLVSTCAIVVGPFFSNNSLTESPGFAVLQQELKEQRPVSAVFIRWLVAAEPLGYPLANGLRIHLLGNFQFSSQ